MPSRSLFRRLRSWRALLVLLLVGLAIGLGSPHAWAWYQLRQARSALARYHPRAASIHLERCLKVWPGSTRAHLLACRAAWQSGDFEEADRHHRLCHHLLGGPSEDSVLEWSLMHAAGGDLRDVEEFLQRCKEEDPSLSPLIWEALVEGCISQYRILDALTFVNAWLQLDPDNLRALELRGKAYQNGKSAHKGADDFRQVIERDPMREATRWRLVLCLLEMGSYSEALPHLERIDAEKSGDPEVQVRLARCRNMLGQGEQARQMLDAVLQEHPEHGLTLRTRGQLALTDTQPEQAERWLRRAVKAQPNDYQSHWLLGQALQQQRKTEEARVQLRSAEAIKDRLERLGELRSRKLSEQPLDPALHYEMGVLLLRTGHKDVGERWLLSALNLDRNYRPAHAALAEHFQRQGDAIRAAEHRRQAQ